MLNEFLSIIYIKHKNQIKHGGAKILFKKLLNLFFKSYKIFNFFIALIIFILQRIFSFFIIIRIGRLRNDKFGHITTEIENYLNEKEKFNSKNNKHFIDLFYQDEFKSNKYFIKMRSRNIKIVPTFFFKELFYLNLFLKQKKYICGSKQSDRDIFNLLDNTKSKIIFTSEEIRIGKSFLKFLGINDSPYVCLIVRDEAYFSYKPFSDYRNANIQNYIPAINFLTNNGYYVIRMGAKVKNKLEINNNKFFDYASSKYRNEFLDIFIGANCVFNFGTSTGFDGIPMSSRKPLLITNSVPLGYLPSWSKKIVLIMKHHLCSDTKAKLSLTKIINNGLLLNLNGKEYEHKGIKLQENTPEEILDATIEMFEKVSKKWQFHKEQWDINQKFLSIYPKNLKDREGNRLHGEFLSQIGYQFLKKNSYLLKD